MPRNDSILPMSTPFKGRMGEVPLTRIVPMDSGPVVDILQVHVPRFLGEFAAACHSDRVGGDPIGSSAALKHIGRGEALGQCLEIVRFHVRISFMSRVATHQLVRARVGVTFSQQCTGDIDCRHFDVIRPNPFGRDPNFSDRFASNVVRAKQLYADVVDSGKVSIQEARYILPQGLSSVVHADICLGALSALYRNRCDVMTQTWEMVLFSRALRAQIVKAAPWCLPLFEAPSKSWFHRTRHVPFANTHLWAPDPPNDLWEWNPDSFVYGDRTHEEMSSGPKVDPSHHIGEAMVDLHVWAKKAREYGADR